MACAGGQLAIVKLLLKHDGTCICDGDYTPLMNACKKSDSVGIVRELIRQVRHVTLLRTM